MVYRGAVCPGNLLCFYLEIIDKINIIGAALSGARAGFKGVLNVTPLKSG
jgi:hypothetical protein